jgi:hypothetical protein
MPASRNADLRVADLLKTMLHAAAVARRSAAFYPHVIIRPKISKKS